MAGTGITFRSSRRLKNAAIHGYERRSSNGREGWIRPSAARHPVGLGCIRLVNDVEASAAVLIAVMRSAIPLIIG
jgi:hypothetical protein